MVLSHTILKVRKVKFGHLWSICTNISETVHVISNQSLYETHIVRSNRGNWVFNVLYLLNCACHDQSLYEAHTVSHIWYFSWPHDLWPWMTFKGQIKYNWVFNLLYLLNGACYDQSVHETHIGSPIRVYSTNHVYLHRCSRLWFCVCV